MKTVIDLKGDKMRLSSLCLMLFLVGCTQSEVLFPDTIPNPNCVQDKNITIVRVLKNYVLGWIDHVDDPVVRDAQAKYQITDPHFVFIPRHPEGVYAINQTVTLADDSCLVYRGAYQYQYNDNQKGVLLVGQLAPSQIEITD